jgi:hypothetical protein
MDCSLRYVVKYTSELDGQEINDILAVLNSAFPGWGDRSIFDWKYASNTYGDSAHLLVYEGSNPVGSAGFWRNDLDDQPAYQCVDLAVSSDHQRRGISRKMIAEGVDFLSGAYLYTFPNGLSRPGFLRQGWVVKRKVPITVHSVSQGLKTYRNHPYIAEKFAEWRFARHPTKQYHVCYSGGQIFLLTKRREHCYAVGGPLEADLGLPEAAPRFLLSYDFPDRVLKVPRHLGWLLENTSYRDHSDFILGYRSDGW